MRKWHIIKRQAETLIVPDTSTLIYVVTDEV